MTDLQTTTATAAPVTLSPPLALAPPAPVPVIADDQAEGMLPVAPEKARELLEQSADDGRVLGTDPENGREIVAKAGRYGPYVTEVLPEDTAETPGATKTRGKTKAKPRPASLFTDMDLATIDLDTALKLLSLPRVVGKDEEGVEITAQNGRYGPYLKKGTDSRSLETEQQLFDVTLEQREIFPLFVDRLTSAESGWGYKERLDFGYYPMTRPGRYRITVTAHGSGETASAEPFEVTLAPALQP